MSLSSVISLCLPLRLAVTHFWQDCTCQGKSVFPDELEAAKKKMRKIQAEIEKATKKKESMRKASKSYVPHFIEVSL